MRKKSRKETKASLDRPTKHPKRMKDCKQITHFFSMNERKLILIFLVYHIN